MLNYVLMYKDCIHFSCLIGSVRLLPILNGDLLKTLEVRPPPKGWEVRSIVGI